jgi:hypothetical protein
MGKIEVMVSESANDLPPSLWHEDWTVEQLDEAIAEAEKNPPKSWAEAAQAAGLWVAPKYRDEN